MYGLFGKCSISGIETKVIAGKATSFYKLEVVKSTLSRSTRPEPAIWVPLDSARAKGLRPAADTALADEVLKILASREYYFSVHEAWSSILPKLEATIASEGALGLAKAYSYLWVLRKKQIVPAPETNRLFESVQKVLFRELGEALQVPPRAIDEKVTRALRNKAAPDV